MATLDLSGSPSAASFTFRQASSGSGTQVTYSVGGGVNQTLASIDDVFGTNNGDTIRLELGLGNFFHLPSFTGGSGNDTVILSGRGSYDLCGITGVESYRLGNTATMPDSVFTGVADGRISVELFVSSLASLPSFDFSGVATGHNVNVTMSSIIAIPITGGAGDDVFIGSLLQTGGATGLQVLHGGLGRDAAIITTNGSEYGGNASPAALANIDGIEYFEFAGAHATHNTITTAQFVGVTGGMIGAALSPNGGTLDGSSLSSAEALWLIGSAAADTLKGGAADDVFQFAAANLTGADTVRGGAGHDALLMSTSGTVVASGVSEVEFYQLMSGGSNSLTLTNANVAGLAAFGGQAGSSGDTIDASLVTSTSTQIYLFGASGNDTLNGSSGNDVLVSNGGNDWLRGEAGVDLFSLSTTGISTIDDFQSGVDTLFFSNALFDLGDSEGSASTYDRLATSAFSTAGDGSFSSPDQRFSFNTTTHELFYAPQGSSSASGTVHVIATLSSVVAGDLFYGA